jgi:hypothetical protein
MHPQPTQISSSPKSLQAVLRVAWGPRGRRARPTPPRPVAHSQRPAISDRLFRQQMRSQHNDISIPLFLIYFPYIHNISQGGGQLSSLNENLDDFP